MTQRTARRVAILAGFLCVMVALDLAGAPGVAADDWAVMADKPPEGISANWWNRLLDCFREKPYSVAEIQPSLDEVTRAVAEGVPAEAVLIRLVEGAVKQADEAALLSTVRQRVEALLRASEILGEPGSGASDAERRHELLPAVASALESRVAADAVRRALKSGRDLRTCRLRTVLEVGESLKLMGLSDDTVSGLMEDFATRDLCCGEMLRAARLAGQKQRAGVPDAQIREQLWARAGPNPPSSADECRHGGAGAVAAGPK